MAASGVLQEVIRFARILVNDPLLAIDGLMFHARRGDLRPELQPFADRVRRRPNAVTCVLASLHADGHVREAAVAAMAKRPRSEYVPFLAERAVEWVEPVRHRALVALSRMIAERPDRCRPLLARELPGLAARRHAAALAALVEPTDHNDRR